MMVEEPRCAAALGEPNRSRVRSDESTDDSNMSEVANSVGRLRRPPLRARLRCRVDRGLREAGRLLFEYEPEVAAALARTLEQGRETMLRSSLAAKMTFSVAPSLLEHRRVSKQLQSSTKWLSDLHGEIPTVLDDHAKFLEEVSYLADCTQLSLDLADDSGCKLKQAALRDALQKLYDVRSLLERPQACFFLLSLADVVLGATIKTCNRFCAAGDEAQALECLEDLRVYLAEPCHSTTWLKPA